MTELSPRTIGRELPAMPQGSPTLKLSGEGLRQFQNGLELLEEGRPGEAVAVFSRVLEGSPGCADAHICLGVAHAMTSRIYSAFDHLERAIQLQPENFLAHYLLSQLNFALRIPHQGYEQAKRALQYASSRADRNMIARLLHQERARKRNGVARPWFNKPFSASALVVAGSGLAAALAAIVIHLR